MSWISTIVNASIDVIKIINLKQWDIIKIVDTETSYNDDKIKYAIVENLYNDWEKNWVEFTVIKTESYGSSLEIKSLFLSDKDSKYLLSPSNHEQLRRAMENKEKYMLRDIKEAEEKLLRLNDAKKFMDDIISWLYIDKLTTPEYEIIKKQ